ncbi:MAG: hypothetical protein AAFW46_06680 [Pseudomonadota bacterium]
MRSPFAAVSAAVFGAAIALAAAAQTQPEIARLDQLQNGDAACSLLLTTPGGEALILPGDFDLCARDDLIGTDVALRYATADMLAPSCEGDPDCPDTVSATIVTEIRPAP